MSNIDTTITVKELLPIFEGITDAVFIDDADGICQWCNDACEDMYNTTIEEIQGKTVDELKIAIDKDYVYNFWIRCKL